MYQFSEHSQELKARLQTFMDEHIFPNEDQYAQHLHHTDNRWAPIPLMDELKTKAREAGLWNLFVPPGARPVRRP